MKKLIPLFIVVGALMTGWQFVSAPHNTANIVTAKEPAPAGFISAPAELPETEDPYAEFKNFTDDEVIKRFSETFLAFDSNRCHFTNNQGLNIAGVFHDGYDFNCLPLNTAFLMTIKLPLLIKETGRDPLYGNYIIAHDLTGRFTFIFGHLSENYAVTGTISDTDKPLFKTGATGNASGVHLHVEIMKNGFPVQFDELVYNRFKTIYKKEEQAPADVIAKVLKITPETARQEYLSLVSNTVYPLNWYKIISLALYEKISLAGLMDRMSEKPLSDYYQFATYFIQQKGLKELADRAKELTRIRTFLYAFTRNQFIIDKTKEAAIIEAEKAFKEANPKDYPGVVKKKKK